MPFTTPLSPGLTVFTTSEMQRKKKRKMDRFSKKNKRTRRRRQRVTTDDRTSLWSKPKHRHIRRFSLLIISSAFSAGIIVLLFQTYSNHNIMENYKHHNASMMTPIHAKNTTQVNDGTAIVTMNVNDTTNIDNDESKQNFDWNELDVINNKNNETSSLAKCGQYKCLWLSSSTSTNNNTTYATSNNTTGWLIADGKMYEKMILAYDFTQRILETKCKAKHLYLSKPMLMKNISSIIIDTLNGRSMTKSIFRDFTKKRPGRDDVYHHHHHGGGGSNMSSLVVQMVRVAPEPNLMFGVASGKWRRVVDAVPSFQQEILIRNHNKNDDENVSNEKYNQTEKLLQNLKTQLVKERERIECALNHSESYCDDFQGFVDVYGNFWHLDVDSQYDKGVHRSTNLDKSAVEKERNLILSRFDEMIQLLTLP